MGRSLQIAASFALFSAGNAMAQEPVLITSKWGSVAAELADNAAARSLAQKLPLTLEMSDHLRQEKTGNLPAPLPLGPRQVDFVVGTFGLWGPDNFVIYYRNGRVPQPRLEDRMRAENAMKAPKRSRSTWTSVLVSGDRVSGTGTHDR